MGFLFGDNGQEHLEKAAAEFKLVKTPEIRDQRLQLEKYVEQGILTPEQAETYLQGESAMNDIETDPRLQQAQYDALGSLQEIGENDGLTSMDRAKLAQIQTQEDTAARGAREAILQNAQARGLGGSGIELMSQMQNQQDAATRASQRGMDVAALAEQRALDALAQAGQLGGQMQQTQFGQKAQIAGANDAISQFNTANRNQVGMFNTGANNAAQATNLQNKQGIANANTDLSNQQQQHNKGLIQQDFQNQMAKAQGAAGIAQNQASAEQDSNKTKSGLLGTALSAGAVLSDENQKECIEEFDPSEFLDNLTSYKFNYKKPEYGEGKQVGVMAQDIEKAAPQMVKDTPEGKVVDYGKAAAPLFASLASLHDRIKKLEGGGV